MASKSTIEKQKQNRREVEKYKELRQRLKREGDYAALQRLPRGASPTRLNNMCALTGRTKGVYRKFGISRIKLRELAHAGKIPGMRKSSW